MKMKIWLWIFEFKLKRVADDKKIEFLAKKLLEELELQGYSLYSTDDIYGVEVKLYTSDNKLHVRNIVSKYQIQCGTYKPKLEDK